MKNRINKLNKFIDGFPNLQPACLGVVIALYVVLISSKLVGVLNLSNQAPFLAAIDRSAIETAYVKYEDGKNSISDKLVYWSYVFHKGNPDVLYLLAKLERDSVINTADALRRAIANDPMNHIYASYLYDYEIRKSHPGELLEDMKRFGGKGIEPIVASAIYQAGLQYADDNKKETADIFIRTASEALPENSFIQIEYATLELLLGNRLSAEKIIDTCSKNIHAGEHCKEVKPLFKNDRLPPLGFYKDKLPNTLCFGKNYPDSIKLLNNENCDKVSP